MHSKERQETRSKSEKGKKKGRKRGERKWRPTAVGGLNWE